MSDFWSRRKAAVEAESRAEVDALEQAQRAETEAQLAERSDEDLLAEAGLPLPEEITNGEMARKFLESQLPRRLKNRALRALWRSNPVLACLDGLNDYDDDFTIVTPASDFRTTYQVGKGLLAHLEHIGRDEPATGEAEAEVATAPLPQLRVPETLGPTVEAQPDLPPLHPAEPTVTAIAEPDPEPEESPLPPSARRMRFTFETS